ncbi:MAG: polymer-forming cytoskeletal protein [Myxococcota bacterium]|nr:polymer-forming cytoskeletal protein [Myxococcota bacterium]
MPDAPAAPPFPTSETSVVGPRPVRRTLAEVERMDPVLGPGAEFSGLLVLHGAARIEGRVSGEVMGAQVLCIGPGASVEASLAADEIVVAGEVQGDLRGRERVELRPGARVRGAVETARLSVAEGSFFEGPCRTARGGDTPSSS